MRSVSGLIGDPRSVGGVVRIVLWVIVVFVLLYVLGTLIWFIVDGFHFTEGPSGEMP